MTARFLIGDVFDRMAELEDGSVDLILTSPPFLALRSYLPAGHPDKGKEIGSEPTPAAFLDTLLRLSAEWRRLLAPHGSICVELGDTYANDNGGRVSPQAAEWLSRTSQTASRAGIVRSSDGWPMAKSLCGIPHLYHLSLAYGRNLLTGEPSPAGSWRVRNVVAWCRPNPPVGALGDKFRPGTSYMTVACVSGQRYFDLDAVRTDYKPGQSGAATQVASKMRTSEEYAGRASGVNGKSYLDGAGAPPLDWWEIPTHGYPGAHYATWPAALCERPIKAMCPTKVCVTCGEPSRRIVENSGGRTAGIKQKSDIAQIGGSRLAKENDFTPNEYATVGWSDCGHNNWRTGTVLDPFAGSGTTLAVATGHGRNAIGIDIDERNAELALNRVGPLILEVKGR